jgi:N6-L-threonylcarbamoyladenine synthase
MHFPVLGIESSCDETSASVVRLYGERIELLSDVTARQEEVHLRWGGVVPELASRKHLESLLPCVRKALADAGLGYRDLHAVAVTNRPGLVGSLLIGVNGARAICYAMQLPLVTINHLEAHLAAVLLDGAQVSFPCLGLIISGGHTSLYRVEEGWTGFQPLGHTRDDAAGEAFDKGARLLGLPYPGGPQVARLASAGNPAAIDFPRAPLSRKRSSMRSYARPCSPSSAAASAISWWPAAWPRTRAYARNCLARCLPGFACMFPHHASARTTAR